MQSQLNYSTLGELVRKYRDQAGLTLTDLAKLTGISKGALSRIEHNVTKRPEIKTIKAIGTALEIPYTEMLSYYVKVEDRSEVLKEILSKLIKLSNIELVGVFSAKIAECADQDTYRLLEYLFNLATTDIPIPLKVTLYDTIITYTKNHGIHYWLAKSLLQKYLIERNDFTRLKESYELGKEILYVINYLPSNEKPMAYWKLGIHAYNLKEYEECVELCKQAVKLAPDHPELLRSAILAIVPSAFETGDYETAEEYLNMMEQMELPAARKSARFTRAIIYSKQGNLEMAIPMLEECFDVARQNGDIRIVLIANELLEALDLQHDNEKVQEIFGLEKEILSYDYDTPFQLTEVGKFYRFKGIFHMSMEEFESGISCFLNSMSYHQKTGDFNGINECTKMIHHYHFKFQRSMDLPLLEKLNRLYNMDFGKEGKN
ncbi:helix-turn-helix domain-containing protein [Brevibacillus dissolubilis]|uniref:helix-turn-helix domain-containing protein n=1 Tax=Brevibacillus dissolubilis TaxID=1844116 RepID=UPI001115D498|nr:helix-turn-helix domain-containing protein [Brevibacillus dissolubilis]